MAASKKNVKSPERDTQTWIKALTESLLPEKKDGPTSTGSERAKDNTAWIRSLAEELFLPYRGKPLSKKKETSATKKDPAGTKKGPIPPSEDTKKSEEKSSKVGSLTETIEPYMEPLKKMKRVMIKQRKDEKLSPDTIARKTIEKESKKQKKRLEKEAVRDESCECFPKPFTFFPAEQPYPAEPCTCYGPDPIKPGPKAGYLGMGYPPPRIQGPEFKRVPGAKLIVDELPNYSVTSFGRGLIPSFEDTAPDAPKLIVHSFLLTGEKGFQVEVSQLGARIVAIRAPDAKGKVEDVILGFDRPEEYITNKDFHWGGVVGRIADRVRGPRPQIHVPAFGYALLPENDDRDYNMGGPQGMEFTLWEAHVRPSGVLFTLVSAAGTDGLPGNVILSVAYSIEPVNRLVVRTEAVSTAATPLTLATPLAFNLAGHGAGEEAMMSHVLSIHADKYYSTTPPPRREGTKDVPDISGFKKNVGHTPYDFRIPRKLEKMIEHTPMKMYDELFCSSTYKPNKEPQCVAKMSHPKSRRVLEVWSDLPVLRVSTNLGLPHAQHYLPDPRSVADVYAIIEEIVSQVPKSTWVMIDSEPGIILADGTPKKTLLPGGDERPPSRGPLIKIPPALMGLPMRVGYGDQRASHPGIKALPMKERGPNRLPFDETTMEILRSGGLLYPELNPVGYVEPDISMYGEDYAQKRKSRARDQGKAGKRRGGNLRPSKVGTVPRRVQSEAPPPRDSKLERHGGTLTEFIEEARGSLGDQFPKYSKPSRKKPRSKSMPAEDSLDKILKKSVDKKNETPFYTENTSGTWQINRLRGGADYPSSYELSTGQNDFTDPFSQSYTEQPDMQNADQWAPPLAQDYYYPPANVSYAPSGYDSTYNPSYPPSYNEGVVEPYPYTGDAQDYNQYYYDQTPYGQGYDQYYPTSSEFPPVQEISYQHDQQPYYQDYNNQIPQPELEFAGGAGGANPPPEIAIGDEKVPDSVQPRFYSIRSIWEGPPRSDPLQPSADKTNWPFEEPPPPPIGRWPGTRYDRQSFGVPEQLVNPRKGKDQFRTSGLGSILKEIGKIPSSLRVRSSSDESIVMRHDLRRPVALQHIDLDNVEVDPPKPPDRLSNINLLDTRLEGLHLEEVPQDEIPDVVRYLYAKPDPEGYQERSKQEINRIVRDLLDGILDTIKTPPPDFRGFNNNLYTNNGAIILMPQREPLYADKSNVGDIILRPGQRYKQTVMYIFGIREKKPPKKKRPPMGQSEPTEAADMVDQCSVEASIESESTDSFQGLHDNCSSLETSLESI